MTTIFVVGTFWFWLLLVAAVILLIIALENDAFWKATLVVAVTITVLIFMGAGKELGSVGSAIWHNPGTSVLCVLGYLLVGSGWSVYKWIRFLKEYARNISETDGKIREYELKGLVKNNKTKLINWMTYWPFSMLWAALSDPFHEIYIRLTGLYDRLAKKYLGHLVKD